MNIFNFKYGLIAAFSLGLSTLWLVTGDFRSTKALAYLSIQDSSGQSELLSQQQQSRAALVIGNASYVEGSLTNPTNDAADIAASLETLGFEVTLLLDQDLRSMESAIDTFNQQLREGSVGAFYYAGHGVQVDGENYLIPVDAELSYQADVRYEALALGKVLNAMESSESQVNIIIVDACRDNPFYRQWRLQNRNLSSPRGLAFQTPPEGTIISFATSPGDVAEDGTGRNSPYTRSLLRHMHTEDVDINAVLRLVRADVSRETESRQTPWYQESLVGFFYLNPASDSAEVNPSQQGAVSTSQTPSLTATPTLVSAITDVDYQPLSDALREQDFKRADEITLYSMREVMGIEPPSAWSQQRREDLARFPCEDLEIINQLWLNHSDGKFGFSVQREIYQRLGGSRETYGNQFIYNSFGEQVGWRANGQWLGYNNLTFSSEAVSGHFPASIWAIARTWDVPAALPACRGF